MNKIMNFMAIMPFIMLSFLASAQTTRGKKGIVILPIPSFRETIQIPVF
jgi:hypothetical protein